MTGPLFLVENPFRPKLGVHNAPIMDSDCLSGDQLSAFVIQSISVR